MGLALLIMGSSSLKTEKLQVNYMSILVLGMSVPKLIEMLKIEVVTYTLLQQQGLLNISIKVQVQVRNI